jgi:excinuclease UvrABC nuclease subunit
MRDSNRRQLATGVHESVPCAPGVYAFVDGSGRLLYVGKSVNLRQRMTSYFRQDPLTAEPHLGRLAASIRSFAWWQTQSDLLALLLEDALIKEHLPPHNTRQREMAESRYLEWTDDDFPACLIVEHVPDFGSRDVFGPLRDKYFAATLRDILRETLGIRACREPEPVIRCLEYDIGRCAGPCRGALEQGEYQELVALARDFLRGDGETVLDRLVETRDLAAAAKRYEEAARLRNAISTCRRFEAHQRFANRFIDGDCSVHSVEDDVEYRFAKGALVAPRGVVVARGHSERKATVGRAGFQPEAAGRDAAAILHQPPSADRRFLADRTRIVCNWVRRRSDGCHVWFGDVEGQVPEEDLSRLVGC